MKREPVLIVMSVLVALQLVTGSAALADVVGLQAAGLAIVVVGGAQAGIQFYVRGQVAPWYEAAAQETPDGSFRAGPAAERRTNGLTKVGDVVDVLRPPTYPA